MTRRVHQNLAVGVLVLAVPAIPSCASRELACPGFDACEANTDCPVVRCSCGGGAVSSPPTCRSDGTCTTTVDCAEVCASTGGCAKPPADCLAFVATECACSGGPPRYAAAWDCVDGETEPTSALDCDEACGATSTGTSGSSTATGASP